MPRLGTSVLAARRNISRGSGFVVVREMFCGADLDKLLRWTEEARDLPEHDEAGSPDGVFKLFERPLAVASPEGRPVLSRVEKMADGHEGFRELLGPKGPLAAALAEIFGEAFHPFKEKIHYKLPGGGGYRWRVDRYAHFKPRSVPDSEYVFQVCAVALDDATEANGGIRLLPEAWPTYRSDDVRGLSSSDGTLVPLKRGDMLIYDHWMPHMSKANPSSMPRRTLFAVYNPLRLGRGRTQYYRQEVENRRKVQVSPNSRFFTGEGVPNSELRADL